LEEEEEETVQYYDNVCIQRSIHMNMNKLLQHFHSTQNYPEFYLGKVEKMALCKCPISLKDEWFSATNLGINKPPKPGTIFEINRIVKKEIHSKLTTFIRWEPQPFYEWRMSFGNVLQLRQDFIDGLSAEDRRYLKMKSYTFSY
jgi:hypothetical protein